MKQKKPKKQNNEPLLAELHAAMLSVEWSAPLPPPCPQDSYEDLPLFGGELEAE